MIQMVMIMAGARKKNTYESHNGLSQLIMNSNTKKNGSMIKKNDDDEVEKCHYRNLVIL